MQFLKEILKTAMRRQFTAVAILVAAETAEEAPPRSVHTLSLDRVLTEVVSNNPALKAARAHWEAMGARVPQARAWEDPRVGVDVERSGTTRFNTFTDNEWMLAQTIPLSGKNRQRARAASAETEGARADLRRLELDLTARARIAYSRYANVQTQLEINRKNELLLNQLVEITRTKYEVGTRTQTDMLVAETDLARLLKTRAEIERQLSDEQSQLNVLMNRPAYAELPPPVPSTFKPLVSPRFRSPPSPHGPQNESQFILDWPLFLHEMHSLALARRPELLRARTRIEAAKALQDLAKRAWIPDPELRLEARQFSGRSGGISEYDTGIFFNFPWGNRGKYKAAIEEARQSREAAEQDLAALQAETLGLVRNQVKKIETLQLHYQFTRDRILPLAQLAEQSAFAAYSADRVTAVEVFTVQRGLLEAETMLPQHLADYLSAIAELEVLVGASVEFPPAVEPRP